MPDIVTIQFRHERACPTCTDITDPGECYACGGDRTIKCEPTLEFVLDVIPGEWYGTDADGNRGVWQSAYFVVADQAPERCPDCGREFTSAERKEIESQADKAAADMVPSSPWDDYDPYDSANDR